EPIHLDQRARPRSGAILLPLQLHLQLLVRRDGDRESVARQYTRMDHSGSSGPWQLAGQAADRLSRTLRVQFARNERGLLAAERSSGAYECGGRLNEAY